MSKRRRELTQRLEELFSAPTDPEASTESASTPGAGMAQLTQALAAQNDPIFLATLINHLPLPIYIKDREHKWIAVNPGFAQLLKRSADQLIGHADKEQSDTDWQHDDHVLETARPEETETSIADFEGSQQRQHVSRLPLLDRDGIAQFMIGIVQQIIEPTPVSESSSDDAIALENARLFAQTQQELSDRQQTEQAVQRRADQLAALNRIGRQLVQLAPASEILETIYQSIGQLIDNRNFYLALHDEGDPEIHYPIYTFDNVRSEPFSRAYGQALTEYVLTTQQPILIPQDVNGYLAQIGVESVGRLAQCWMGAPLLVGKQAIGVIALQDYERSNAYTQSDVELLTLVASQAAIALQNTRLFTQTQTRVDELAVLNQIGQAASGLLNVDELLELTYRQVSQVMRTDRFFVGLYDPNLEMISYPLYYKDGEIFHELDAVMKPDTHSYQVITTGQPLMIEYSEADRQTILQQPETLIGDNEGLPASVLFAPLKIGERVLGVMAVQCYEAGKHTADNHNLLISIANQVAISLENARLFEQTRSRADELSVLNELAQRLSARLSTDQLLDETYQGIKRLMDAENFFIGLYDQPKHQISFMLNVTQSEADREITRISADDGISGYIIRNRTSVLVGNGINQWAHKMGMRPVGQNALSWLGVPMIVGNQVLGVMAVQNYEKAAAYSEHDRELLAVFANQAATAIQNALLFERTQRDGQRERTINRISAKIRNTQSVEQILRIATEELRLATQSARSIAQIAPAAATPSDSSSKSSN